MSSPPVPPRGGAAGLAARGPEAVSVATLDAALWHERDLLESLLQALRAGDQALAAGSADRQAVVEAERLAEAVRETALLCAMEADALATSVGLEPAPSLPALAAAVGGAWGTILAEHGYAVDALTHEVSQLAFRDSTHVLPACMR